jgi:hypothetical protein
MQAPHARVLLQLNWQRPAAAAWPLLLLGQALLLLLLLLEQVLLLLGQGRCQALLRVP